MKRLKFGIEIEFIGITREAAATIVADFFGTGFFYEGGELKERGIEAYAEEEQCELVTPILQYEDLECLKQLLQNMQQLGARVNRSCGLHIHVDGKNFTPQAIVNLVTLIGSRELLLYKALSIPKDRMKYCKRINDDLVDLILEVSAILVALVQATVMQVIMATLQICQKTRCICVLQLTTLITNIMPRHLMY